MWRPVVLIILTLCCEAASPAHSLPYCGIPSVSSAGGQGSRGDAGGVGVHIVGGVEAQRGSWPWQCRLTARVGSGRTLCGASVIDRMRVITAAHCVYNGVTALPIESFRIYCGDHNQYEVDAGEQLVYASRVIAHRQYNPANHDSDVAIIELVSALNLSTHRVTPVCLPSSPVAFGTNCVVTGWGEMQASSRSLSDVLREVVVPIYERTQCAEAYAPFALTVTDNMLCAGYTDGGKDSCQGDSGGPLVCKVNGRNYWELYGLVSWGKGCAAARLPGVYTDVVAMKSWIEENTANDLEPEEQKLRLTGSNRPHEGRLEIYHLGSWGTVCDDEFDEVDAKVACNSMGFGYIGYPLGNKYGAGSGLIFLDDLRCSGGESFLGNCEHGGWGVHNCRHVDDVSVACNRTSPTTAPSVAMSAPDLSPTIACIATAILVVWRLLHQQRPLA